MGVSLSSSGVGLLLNYGMRAVPGDHDLDWV